MSTQADRHWGWRIEFSPKRVARNIFEAILAYPPSLKRWMLGLLVVMFISLGGAAAALPAGWEVLGTNPTVEWGLLIAGYVFFAITTSGICFAVSLGSVFGIKRFKPLERRGVLLAFFSLLSAFWVILLDLQEPIRLVFGAILSPSPLSPMWWMGVAYAGYLVILIVEIITMFAGWHAAHKVAAIAAAVMAVVAPSTLGRVFGAIGAKALWQGTLTPVLMFTTAFLCGVAILSIVLPVAVKIRRPGWEQLREQTVPALRWLLLVMVLVVTAVLIVWVSVGLAGGYRGLEMAMHELVFGAYAVPFWGIRIGVGIVLPLILLLGRVGRRPLLLIEAGAAALIGVLADRFLFVVVPEAKTVTVVAGTVTYPLAHYTPSIVEIVIVAGAVATVAFLYTIVERHLDLSADAGGHA